MLFEALRTSRVTQFGERLALDLADALASDAERAAHFFERADLTVVETEAQAHDLLLAVVQFLERFFEPNDGGYAVIKTLRQMVIFGQQDLGRTDQAVDCPIFERDALASGSSIQGPALIQEYASTTVLFEGDVCTVAGTGELLITVRSAR